MMVQSLNLVLFILEKMEWQIKFFIDNLFEDLKNLYMKALEIDPTDVEANFNLGLLYL